MAFLSPDGDGIKDCYVDTELNSSCSLDFYLPLASEKWAYLTDAYRIYAGGKEFVIQNPDAVVVERDGQKIWGAVKAKESWILLGKKYVTVCNDPSTPDPTAWSAVVIVSGGSDLSGGRYAVGSAGHALYALLNGSGWTVGVVDVEGTYDLETEKESLLSNINKVQETWGGYLVWDSIKKTVSLRSEENWRNYTGFGIHYAKNLKSITRTDDYDIVTRLYPFGEDDLNIGTVNSGVIYLDNHSYTNEVLEGIWTNQDLSDAQQLKDAGTKELAVMCKPRHAYSVKMLDLRTVPGYEHETFDIGHMVDVIDSDLGIDVQVRIIKYKYNVFQPWLCDLDVGDPIEKIQASIADTIRMADFIKSNKSNTGLKNLFKAIINTAATTINGASGDYTLVDGVSTWFDRVAGVLTGKLTRITPQGLIISSDGGQSWNTAIDGDGIYADQIICTALYALASGDGFTKITDSGLEVWDDSDPPVKRVHIGQYALGKFAAKVLNGEIYGSLFKTGDPDATSKYVEISNSSGNGYIKVVGSSGTQVIRLDAASDTGRLSFYDTSGNERAYMFVNSSTQKELLIYGYNGGGVYIFGSGNSMSIGPTNSNPSGGVYINGSTTINGTLSCTGGKPAQQVTENYGLRYMYATESPELVYYDRGAINLVIGEATVHLDPIYLECIEPDTKLTPWQIWVQAYGENDVYVSEVGTDYFKVKERNGGTSNGKVVWKHEAIRAGYAGIRLMEVTD